MSTAIDEYITYQLNAEKKYGKNTIVFYENGTFYEIYGVDNDKEKVGQPKRISELLNIAITRKNKKILENSRKNPLMVGVPTAHSEKHIKSLINQGFTIVFVEQTTQPPNPQRGLTKVLSPTTYISDEYRTDNNFVLAIYFESLRDKRGNLNLGVGLCAFDLTVGDGIFYQTHSINCDYKVVFEEIFRFMESIDPKEIVINLENCCVSLVEIKDYLELYRHTFYVRELKSDYSKIGYQNAILKKTFELSTSLSPLEYLNLEFQGMSAMALMLCIDFIYDHDERIIRSLNIPKCWEEKKHLILNNNTLYQLNIVSDGMATGEVVGNIRSLFDIINKTKTVMGKRSLKNWLLNPVVSPEVLQRKYDIIGRVIDGEYWKRYDSVLSVIIDLERFFRKMSIGYLMPHEMSAFEPTLDALKNLVEMGENDFTEEDNNWIDIFRITGEVKNEFMEFYSKYYETFNLNLMATFCLNDINQSFFKVGIVPELDVIQAKIDEKRQFFREEAEKLSKMIDGSKLDCIKFDHNERDGYFLRTTAKRGEMLKKKLGDGYQIKNSGANIARVISDDLDKTNYSLQKLEINIKESVRKNFVNWCELMFKKFHESFAQIVKYVSTIDMTISLGKVSLENNYKKPNIVKNGDGSYVKLLSLRHPIIEKINDDILYVPNDVEINREGILLYGLNGGGKSSLLKAVGLAIVMAQMGMYVPADAMEFYPFKTMYTRIMGNDNIFRGLSSFALEMTELRAILQYANSRSLILGDEICRGTEIHSALSIVSSAVNILCKKTTNFLFATHLHKLHDIDIVKECSNLRHYYIDLQIRNGKLVFGRKIFEGVGRKLYGLEVAEHIVENDEFLSLATKTRKQLLDKEDILGNGEELVNTKKSSYNSTLYVDECEICGKKEGLDVHHINSQKYADCNDTIDFYHKHHKGNLVVLCNEHHKGVHNGEIYVNGWLETLEGRRLEWGEKEKKTVKVHIKKKKEENAMEDVIKERIREYKYLLKNLSLRVIRAKIEKELEMTITQQQIRKVFNEAV